MSQHGSAQREWSGPGIDGWARSARHSVTNEPSPAVQRCFLAPSEIIFPRLSLECRHRSDDGAIFRDCETPAVGGIGVGQRFPKPTEHGVAGDAALEMIERRSDLVVAHVALPALIGS